MKLTPIKKTVIFLLVMSVAGVFGAWHLSEGNMSVFWFWVNQMGSHLMLVGVMFYFCVKPVVKSDDSEASGKRWCVGCHNYH
jgi:hypothetical protein